MAPVGPADILSRVRRDAERNVMRTRNGIRLATGTSRPRLGTTPKDVVWERGRSQLWRYRNDNVRHAPPLFLIPSLVSRSYVLDLTPGNSLVERLLAAGFDVFLIDWGVPDERDAQNRLEDYVDGYLPAAIARACELAGSDDVNALGYCFGGVLALLYAARHTTALRSLSVAATPVDFRRLGPLTQIFGAGGLDVDRVVDENGNIPPEIIFNAFRALQPTAEVMRSVNLWDQLWNDDYVAAHQAMVTWAEDHIPFPGAAARQVTDMFVVDNALVEGRLYLGGDEVRLSDITCPFLTVLATRDHIVPEAATAPLIDLVGSPDKHELRLDAGHVGLFAGRTAHRTTLPVVIDFLERRSRPL